MVKLEAQARTVVQVTLHCWGCSLTEVTRVLVDQILEMVNSHCWGSTGSLVTVGLKVPLDQTAAVERQHCWDYSNLEATTVVEDQRPPLVMMDYWDSQDYFG